MNKQKKKTSARSDALSSFHPVASPPSPISLYPQGSLCRFQAGRIFLSHFGLFALDKRERITPLIFSQQLAEQLDQLDLISERICMQISVFYGQSGYDSVEDVMNSVMADKTKSISSDFFQFLHTLGWPVNLFSHPGFKGDLNSSCCATTPYYSDLLHEIIFRCPCLMGELSEADKASLKPTVRAASIENAKNATVPSPSSISTTGTLFSPSSSSSVSSFSSPFSSTTAAAHPTISLLQNRMESQTSLNSPGSSSSPTIKEAVPFSLTPMMNDHVYIIWLENILGYLDFVTRFKRTAPKELSSKIRAFIFVHPLKHHPGLYLIKIVCSEMPEVSEIGPLTDGTIVSRHCLGHSVRKTAVSIHLLCSQPTLLPFFARRTHIEDIATQYRLKDYRISSFYHMLFSN